MHQAVCFPLIDTCWSGEKLQFWFPKYLWLVDPHFPSASWTSCRRKQKESKGRDPAPAVQVSAIPDAVPLLREVLSLLRGRLSTEELKAQGGVIFTHYLYALLAKQGTD